ncbi:MAG: glycosyltransferase [Mesorhizobium sp.]|nr:MAG: glycosyltransferase [Mesorhizobium sp.]
MSQRVLRNEPAEALSNGTPLVATRVSGMTEIVEATGDGVVVEKNDPEALAAHIIGLS